MEERIALLAALAEAVLARQAHEFEWLVKAAYGAGATGEELLTAVESGLVLGTPPSPVATEAYATVHAWQWMTSCSTCQADKSAQSPESRRAERMKA